MDFEFDKEIDFLLRQTAQSETAAAAINSPSAIRHPPPVHLDADEISAFAENALPEKTKQQFLLHLADCDRCRKNLASLIALNVEQSDAMPLVEAKPLVAAPLAWYRKLFVIPKLVYAMGALVLVFSGLAAWTILQSVGDANNAAVSQTYEKQTGGKGMSADGDSTITESYSSNTAAASNMMMANTAAMNSNLVLSASNSAAMPVAPSAAANANAAISPAERDRNTQNQTKPTVPAKEPMDLAKAEAPNEAAVAAPPPASQLPLNGRNYSQLDGEATKQEQAENQVAQSQADTMSSASDARRAPASSANLETRNKKATSKDDTEEKSKSAATTVGGKTFRRDKNVWYDAAYRGQSTVNVTRGTEEYKKLDAGLRGIAENLGGTVVVVWKQKAYRIQ